MPLHTVELEQAPAYWAQIAARANAGEPCLLTRCGVPYAAVVSPALLAKASPSRFLNLRGTGRGLWGTDATKFVASSRGAGADV